MTEKPLRSRNSRTAEKESKKIVPEENKGVKLDKMVIVKEEGALKYVVFPVIHRFGCANCEWRKLPICPLNDDKVSEDVKFSLKYAKICETRKNFLRYIYTGKSTKPTLRQIERDYRRWTMNSQYSSILKRILYLNDRIEKVENGLVIQPDIISEDKLKEMKEEQDRLMLRMTSIWSELEKSDHKDLDRDSRDKNVEIISGKFDLGLIHRKIVGEIIDTKPQD